MSERFDAIAASQLQDGELPNWLDQLRPASFRGVPFHVDTIEWTAGDNVVVREYPFQDLPTVFRMGAAAQELKFSAYVIGPDYHLQRAALMSALSGEGVLMHPTAGAMRVFVAGKFSVKEAPAAEGGMARFDLHFIRAELVRYPASSVPSQAVAVAKADAAKTAAGDAFASTFKPADKPGHAREKAIDRFRRTLKGSTDRISKAAKGLNDFNARLNSGYRGIINDLNDLVRAPRQLADAMVQLYRLPTDMSRATRRDLQDAFAWAFDLKAQFPNLPFESRVFPAVGAGLVMYGTGKPEAGAINSPAQREATALVNASDALLETLATAAFVELVAGDELQSYDDAMAARRKLHLQLTRLMQLASEAPPADELPVSSIHDALLGLHGAALADLQARSRDLVRLTSYTPESWQPVWFVSHRLYGTAIYADEILELNPHIEHPLLVPPGVPLRVARHD